MTSHTDYARDYVSFIEKPSQNSFYGGIAELSVIDNDGVKDILGYGVAGTWFFFNRLHVPASIRNQGIGTKLMNKVCSFADANGIHILNTVNPYGDLNMMELIAFYKKFEFVPVRDDRGRDYFGLMIRVARG